MHKSPSPSDPSRDSPLLDARTSTVPFVSMFHRLLSWVGLSTAPAAGGGAGDAPDPNASTTIATESVVGSHVLTIDGYSGTPGLGVGRFMSSGTFHHGGHRWSIHYYPDGFDYDNREWISLLLQLDQSYALSVRARFYFNLLDNNGKGAVLRGYDFMSGTCTFDLKGTPWGCRRFIKREELEQSPYLRDDRFRVRCDIIISKSIRRDDGAERFVVVPPSDMSQHLGRLLMGAEGADITFEVAGEMVAAHRCMLAARSPELMAELFGPENEKTAACVRIEDMEASVFRALLHFIYTDSLPEIDKGEEMVVAQHLVAVAGRYRLERLKLICEDKLCSYIQTSTVATVLAFAELHGCCGLKKACFIFLMYGRNLKAAIATDGFFEHLMSSCPSVLKELLAKVAP